MYAGMEESRQTRTLIIAIFEYFFIILFQYFYIFIYMQNSDKEFYRKMTAVFDTVIGGRYIGFAIKAEGLAFVTAHALTNQDITRLIADLNKNMIEESLFRQLQSDNYKITPSHYDKKRYIIEKAPLTRMRWLQERTPLMEIRLFNA